MNSPSISSPRFTELRKYIEEANDSSSDSIRNEAIESFQNICDIPSKVKEINAAAQKLEFTLIRLRTKIMHSHTTKPQSAANNNALYKKYVENIESIEAD